MGLNAEFFRVVKMESTACLEVAEAPFTRHRNNRRVGPTHICSSGEFWPVFPPSPQVEESTCLSTSSDILQKHLRPGRGLSSSPEKRYLLIDIETKIWDQSVRTTFCNLHCDL